MTDLQSRQLLLMDEIKEICEKENLSYVVAGLNAAYIMSHKKYDNEQCYFRIMMPIDDAVKLGDYIEKNRKDRVVESWYNNPDLQMLKFRYVDKNSLFFDGGSPEKVKCYGINITILPTRKFEPDNEARGIELYVQLVNYGQEKSVKKIILFKFVTRVTHMNRFKGYVMRRIKLDNANYIHHGYFKRNKMTKAEMTKYVMDANINATKPFKSARYIPEDVRAKNPDIKEDCLAYMDDKGKVLKFPIDLYTNVNEVEFEGKKFKVYAEIEKYFDTVYGNDWKNKVKEEILGSNRSSIIYDTEIPYEEYLEYTKDDEKSFADIADGKREYNYWMDKVHNPAVNKAWHTFMRVRRSVERIDIWYQMRNKRDKLKEVYEKKDLPKLKKLMSKYLSTTQKYVDEKIGFYIDDELFKYARYIWDNEDKPTRVDENGNTITYAEYVYSLVPDLYKTETPEEYLAKRGKTFE